MIARRAAPSLDAHRSPRAFAALVAAAVAALAPLAIPTAGAVTWTRHPWINLVTPTSALIAWQTDAAATGTVLYGTTAALGSEASHAGTAADHAVPLTGLDPGTLCYYRTVSGGDTVPATPYAFRTAPVQLEPVRFAAFGDLGRATPEQKEIAARIDTLDADLAIVAGDIIYDAGEAANFTPQYFDIYNGPSFRTLARTPFYTCLGNHDLLTSNGQPYLDAFYLPSNSGTERYYSFDYGAVHFAALDVTVEGTAPGAGMLAWLDADLAATAKKWKVVFFHVPAYSNLGGHGNDPVIAAALDPILTSHGVDLVFQGHNHYYSRTYPIAGGVAVAAGQDPDYTDPGAPIYVVAGSAGRALYALGASPPYEAYAKSTFHAVVVDVTGNSLRLETFERDGTVIDAMTLTKQTGTAVTLASFEALPDAEGVRLRWRVPAGAGSLRFNVYRAAADADPGERINGASPITGGPDYEWLDRTADPGIQFTYRLGAVDAQGREEIVGIVRGARGGALEFAVGRPSPNPFDQGTGVALRLDRPRRVRAVVVDVAGRVVRTLQDGPLGAGSHRLSWDGRDATGRPVASGIYYLRLKAGDRAANIRLLRLR